MVHLPVAVGYGRFTMTVQSTRSTRPADRRRQLIEHAAELFVQRGYPHVSMADIARAAGVTAPSLYRHFADKQDLLGAAVLAGVDDLETCTDRALAKSPGSREATVRALIETITRRPESASLWRWTGTYLTDEQNREVALRTRAVLHRWGDVIFDEEDEETDAAPWERSQLTWALLSVAGSSAVHTTRLTPSREVDELVGCAMRLLRLRPSSALHPSSAPPRRAGPPSAPSTTRRDEILDAASQLFADRGYADVGVDEIGAAVGISGPSVYNHFASKAAILVAIGMRSAARLEAGVMAAYATADGPTEILAALVDSYVAVITATPDLSVSFNNSPALTTEAAATELVRTQRHYVARWIELLAEATDQSGTDSRAAAGVAVHAALSIVNDAVRLRRGTSRPEFGAQMAYLMKGVLLP